jgi:UPF0176 protein
MYFVINFYKFIALDDIEALKTAHEARCRELGILGSILLAPEGINGALGSDSLATIDSYLEFLRSDPRFSDIRVSLTEGVVQPFKYFWIKIKNYIVVFNDPHNPPIGEIYAGPRLEPKEFEQSVKEKAPDTVLLDTRNYFEVDYGSFEGAEHLGLEKFRDFPEKFLEKYGDQKDKTFLMYCTGGIRCEKAVAFAKSHGFEKVFQLEGGIINYHKTCGDSLFRGNNFVFDQRWAITPELKQSSDGPHPDRI